MRTAGALSDPKDAWKLLMFSKLKNILLMSCVVFAENICWQKREMHSLSHQAALVIRRPRTQRSHQSHSKRLRILELSFLFECKGVLKLDATAAFEGRKQI